MRRVRHVRWLSLSLALMPPAFLGSVAAAPAAAAKTVWLCRPDRKPNPCTPGLSTTHHTPSFTAVTHPRPVRPAPVDCFYVYPTVSDQKTRHATLRIDPEERSIARWEAGRYSQYCRVFAPAYRQVTVPYLLKTSKESWADLSLPYGDVQRAFAEYLSRYSHGRGFILIGHSQGAALLRLLIRHMIDGNPALRRRLVSAIVLGGNVLVKRGSDLGGDFKHIPACRHRGELGCVIAFSAFSQIPPSNAAYGRVDGLFSRGRASVGDEVLCTNPAALGGGSGVTESIVPTLPFAPGTLMGELLQPFESSLPRLNTVWAEVSGFSQARCVRSNGADVLELTPLHATRRSVSNEAPRAAANPLIGPVAGLHLEDANVALGNLIGIVRTETAAYTHKTGRAR